MKLIKKRSPYKTDLGFTILHRNRVIWGLVFDIWQLGSVPTWHRGLTEVYDQEYNMFEGSLFPYSLN